MALQYIKIVGASDKELWECSYPEYQEQRESTTFWSDFTIADAFGESAIRDTFKRAFGEWKTHYKYLTELVGVLNHKIWEWHEKDDKIAKLYNALWEEADAYGTNNLKDEEARFFFSVLD